MRQITRATLAAALTAGIATGCKPTDPDSSLPNPQPAVPAAPAPDSPSVTNGASCGNNGEVHDYWPRTDAGLRHAQDMCADLSGLKNGIETELQQQGW
ncbi:hypothetical protein [Saccharopolyspora griseoalba]|uniref:Lipoprotein n=1 Tax=Saccharopolyspora griseoalba TaxID=1431848 RepID=A0ABW2LTT9_9PSEU